MGVCQVLHRSRSGIQVKVKRLKLKIDRLGREIEIPETEISYMAGILDGEGWISLEKSKGRLTPLIGVSNNSLILLTYLKERLGGQIYHRQDGTFNLKIVSIPQTYAVLKLLEPYLIVKRGQAQLVIQWCESRRGTTSKYTAKELEIRDKVKEITSRRGRSE